MELRRKGEGQEDILFISRRKEASIGSMLLNPDRERGIPIIPKKDQTRNKEEGGSQSTEREQAFG